LDCGYNVWTTDEEYLKDLRQKALGVEKSKRRAEIEKLEDQLGIIR